MARRGGRQKGTPNKATAERRAATGEAIDAALSGLTADRIAAMTALEIMEFAYVAEALAGRWVIAAELAARVAPYRFAKLAPTAPVAPAENVEERARRLFELQKEMRETIGVTLPLDAPTIGSCADRVH